ncbi:MAG: hypothetical protein A2277_06015 [Desulfobacterales bacterium RIFOXYA12_FULL_46_15]|nr:MAG: hypothetical protein A2277_06015 [Desulfobacterales bacterium RIFOXYA12_FULL_46_15]
MKKLILLLIMVLSTVLSHAEEKKRLLILDSQTQEPYRTLRETVLNELSALGYRKEENLLIEYEIIANYAGRVRNILRHSKKQYDVIFINGTMSAMGALEFINRDVENADAYHFIFGNVTDPVGLGLIPALGVPSHTRFTGIAYPVDVEERLRFVKQIFGKNLKVGYIYAEMPQSLAYNRWLKSALEKEAFRDMTFFFRSVEFVKSDRGHGRMAMLAEKIVRDLDSRVDLFMSPNDQMGISGAFSQMVYRTSTKPLVGIGRDKGCVVSLTPDLAKTGQKLAAMIKQVFEGAKLDDLIPHSSESSVYYDEEIGKKFNINAPEW